VYPLVNIYDDGENLYAEALMPGIDPEQLDVTIVGNSLMIAGEKGGLKDIPPERIHRNERAGGRFVRTVQLPVEIDRDRVDAQYHAGLLRLTLPRAESSKPRRVMIHANGGGMGAGNGQEQRR
jgi:HSP20 family protein